MLNNDLVLILNTADLSMPMCAYNFIIIVTKDRKLNIIKVKLRFNVKRLRRFNVDRVKLL